VGIIIEKYTIDNVVLCSDLISFREGSFGRVGRKRRLKKGGKIRLDLGPLS